MDLLEKDENIYKEVGHSDEKTEIFNCTATMSEQDKQSTQSSNTGKKFMLSPKYHTYRNELNAALIGKSIMQNSNILSVEHLKSIQRQDKKLNLIIEQIKIKGKYKNYKLIEQVLYFTDFYAEIGQEVEKLCLSSEFAKLILQSFHQIGKQAAH